MAAIIDGKNYDLIVIGGGAAGLVSSGFVSALGLNVALVSDGHPGGECLWTGCVPSKALIHTAQVAHTVSTATKNKATLDNAFKTAMSHMKEAMAKISHHDSVETIERNNGVDVLLGRAKFRSSHSIEIDSHTLHASKFIIATGGYQAIPNIEGFDKINCLTHESILELEEKPESICIIGAGPVGVEYCQTLTRLGVKVTLVEFADRILPREEPEVSLLMEDFLKQEGAEIYTSYGASKAEPLKDGKKKIIIKKGDQSKEIECEAVLVATGKTPATKDLNLDKAGVATDQKGFVKTDDHQRTNVPNIWACGDICGTYQFTHYADHTAQVAALGACFPLFTSFFKREMTVVPWCTFTDPEVASVGLRSEEAFNKYGKNNVHVLKYSLEDFDRAILDDQAKGFMLATVDSKAKILGATIVGARAGEIIHEYSLAMKNNIPLTGLSRNIHVYPTMSAAIRGLSSQYYKTVAQDSFSLKLGKLLASWMK